MIVQSNSERSEISERCKEESRAILDGLTTSQLAIYFFVKLFVQRQQLVYDAISAIRPDFLKIMDEKIIRFSKDYIRATQRGYWGGDKEWKYFIHGKGCVLKHVITGEPIEWESPDTKRFDPYWLTNWISWYVDQHPQHDMAQVIMSHVTFNEEDFRAFIFSHLEQLWRHKLLKYHPERTSMYEIDSTE